MAFWDTVSRVTQGIAGVAGVLDILGGDDAQGPNPNVATFTYLQGRVNAAEQVRQLGWQAWMAGQQANSANAHAAMAFRQQGDLLDAADLSDDMAAHSAVQAGQTRAQAAHTRTQGADAAERSRVLSGRAEAMVGVLGRDLSRGYTAATAAYDRTSALVAADTKAAEVQAETAAAVAGATIERAQVAIERATVQARSNVSSLRLQAAQGGLASSSFTQSGAAAIGEDLALTVREQRAVQAGARARAAGAAAQAEITADRGAAHLAYATTQHANAMGAAADQYTRGQMQVDDISLAARTWGTRAAGAEVAAQGLDVQAAGLDLQGERFGHQAQTQRTQAEGAAVRASDQLLAARGAEIQQDFFSTQAAIGTHFLQQQPGVEEYGGQQSILEGMQLTSSAHEGQTQQEDRV